MREFITSPTTVTLLLLFYWVPFAIGAWFADCHGAERTRDSMHRLRERTRHMRPTRPAGHAHA